MTPRTREKREGRAQDSMPCLGAGLALLVGIPTPRPAHRYVLRIPSPALRCDMFSLLGNLRLPGSSGNVSPIAESISRRKLSLMIWVMHLLNELHFHVCKSPRNLGVRATLS